MSLEMHAGTFEYEGYACLFLANGSADMHACEPVCANRQEGTEGLVLRAVVKVGLVTSHSRVPGTEQPG